MKQQQSRGAWLALATVAALGSILAGPHTRAADAKNDEGPIVQIGPDDIELDAVDAEDRATEVDAADDATAPQDRRATGEAVPQYWIGIQGRTVESPVLRTHLQLADDLGVVVEQVVPDSPADLAGLREHDVLIGVNGEPLTDMSGLVKAVAAGKAEPIRLRVIRLAEEIEVTVTPDEMPAEMRRRRADSPSLGAGGFGAEDLLRDFLGDRAAEGLGGFGGIGGRAILVPALPGGVSVSIHQADGGPARITVKQGDETWTFDSDDAESLEQLPEGIRPYVERLLGGRVLGGRALGGRPEGAPWGNREFRRRFDFGNELQELIPDALGRLQGPRDLDDNGAEDNAVLERMQELEQRLEDLQRRLEQQQQ